MTQALIDDGFLKYSPHCPGHYRDGIAAFHLVDCQVVCRYHGGDSAKKLYEDLFARLTSELDAVRPMMIEHHCRYMPVMDNRMLMGVISFYDVAKAVVDSQNFENKMLKAYIRDWPEEEKGDAQ